MTSPRSRISALTSFILIVVSACSSDTTGANAKGVSLSFATKVHAAPSLVGANYVNLLTQTVGGNTLVITKAQIVMSKIELTMSATATCTGDASDSDCTELHANPQIVNLPTDPMVTTALVTAIPAGTYTDFEGKVKVVQSSQTGGADFLTANPAFNGVSVHVEGTFNGTPFTYDGSGTAELELAFATPIVVDSTGMNITVNVDLSTWFLDGSGSLIDPTTANSGGANVSLVDGNIHQSFEAFEDNNKDGTDDSTQH